MESFRLEYCPSTKNAEWLYDFVAYSLDEHGELERVVLCLESEVSDRKLEGIRYDFQKLLLCNAPIRVMLTVVKDSEENTLNGLFQSFQNWIEACENPKPGDRFLILLWDDCDTGEVHHRVLLKGGV
ncbi:hypothetical protein [Croceimicrobium hydrocarbonivorans]|uniref:Uncharacterized protein n=1 Tax=Croceimicrobium hydrocarbonivorans TaxID=2761580 RepID=A0A7H0VE29_9FLAO|nr:hypothetical protein [Croceimicrobium hydrocarbonivorans]QNR23977.1 hypothetical protein H4K34_16630 [Croceimicrobium hydrocarbonivorans]